MITVISRINSINAFLNLWPGDFCQTFVVAYGGTTDHIEAGTLENLGQFIYIGIVKKSGSPIYVNKKDRAAKTYIYLDTFHDDTTYGAIWKGEVNSSNDNKYNHC